MGLKIGQVVPRIAQQSSGMSEATPRLCDALYRCGADVKLFTLKPIPVKTHFKRSIYCDHSRLPFGFRFGWSREMKKTLADFAREGDVIHGNSLWMMPNIYPEYAVRGTNCKLVMSPHGTLSKWSLKRSRHRKKIVWLAGQRRALQRADCLHATSATELDDIRSVGLTAPVAVIPNGVSLPEYKEKLLSPEARTLLFLSRIHPKKGLDVLLNAWERIVEEFPHWSLKIAGPLDSQYAKDLQGLARSKGLARVQFIGEILGEAKDELYRNSDLFVLPTHSENFGICVAEALACQVPAIVFQGAPWDGLEKHKAGWWIEPTLDSLVETLRKSMSLSDLERLAMGRNGRAWVASEFDWLTIANRMIAVYEWLLGYSERPAEVYS